MTVRLLAATSNPGKLRDFNLAAGVIAGAGASIVPLPGLASIHPPEEDQDTFEGNARLKAIYYSQSAPGQLVLADDSGLEVDALHGAPGVRSARYADDMNFLAGSELSQDARNNLCLLAALRDVPVNERRARYRCDLVAVRDGTIVAGGSGSVDGRIVSEARGDGGFGYDPHFVPEGKSQTMAELTPEMRLSLSHRGRALHDLLAEMLALHLP